MNTPDSAKQERNRTRRRFFKWAGEIAAGISLAGLGLARPLNAFACTPCPTSGTFYTCCHDGVCGDGTPYHYKQWQYTGGCAINHNVCTCNRVFTGFEFCGNPCGSYPCCG